MADTTYTDFQPPAITASWLNDLNRLHYQILGNPLDGDDVTTALSVADITNNGMMSAADKVKLDGIENNATDDQTGAEIKVAYEAEPNTNVFTDSEKSKLAGIEDGATAEQTASDVPYNNSGSSLVATNVQAAIDEEDLKVQNHINNIGTVHESGQISYDNTLTGLASTDVQGAIDELGGTAVTSVYGRTGAVVATASDYNAGQVDYSNISSSLTATNVQSAIDEVEGRVDSLETDSHTHSNKAILDLITAAFTVADETKLDGIESGATADQTPAEIKLSYESNADTNAFTDSFQSKLNGIESGAKDDQSASEVPYNNVSSGLTATNVQAAIDEIDSTLDSSVVTTFNSRTGTVVPATGDYDAVQVDYDNTTSGLTATNVNAAIDEVSAAGAIPAGIISLWSGSVASIPTGWNLCDGTNGTPDLRNRFVVGAGSSYSPGNTGGSSTHSHSITVNNHTLTTSQIPAHTHDVQTRYTGLASGLGDSIYGVQNIGTITTAEDKALSEGGGGSHNHTASSASVSNLPPYYALAYIMKL